jgi:cobyrinic acid a,c-diamide synthase
MYLGRALTDLEGRRMPMAGVLPVETVMLDKLQSLGYVEVTPVSGSPWQSGDGAEPLRLRGHEFHYSRIGADEAAASGWGHAYRTRRRGGAEEAGEGFCKGSIIAGYVHLHFGSCPEAARRLVAHWGESR